MGRIRPNHIVLGIAILAVAGIVYGQSSSGGTSKSKARAGTDEIHEVATEYVDLLQGLRDVISDYSDYLGSDGLDSRAVLETSLDKFSEGLDEEIYMRDNKVLEQDLSAVSARVVAERAQLGKSSDARSQKAMRVLRSFERELQLIQELLSEHNARLAEMNIRQAEVADAVGGDLSSSLEKLKQSLKLLQKNSKKTYVIEMPPIPKAPVPSIPSVPSTGTPAPTIPRIAVPPIGAAAGVRGMPREFSGTMHVTSSGAPIYISNPSGNVEVAGWGESDITVVLEVEIASGSRATEKELIDQISLTLENPSNGRYNVRVGFPRISDPKTRIVASRLAVNVPFQNRIYVENAFGDMDVSDLRGGVEVTGNVSQIQVSSIRGGTTVKNAMGAISVSDVSGGPTFISNSYGTISANSIEGPMTIQNAFATVSVEDTHGELRINNSGSVEVSSHEGNVSIDNSYGAVTLGEITGNVTVKNAFQSIEAQSISGSAQLANQYGSITAEEVGDGLSVSNSFGSTDLSQIRGRLDLNSTNGSLRVNLDGQLLGASTIVANAGSVFLNLADNQDLLFKARVEGGSVTSEEPMDMSNDGSVKTVVLRLGAGRQALSLRGIGSSIVIARD